MQIRTRIAPSPTGMLHVGTARTALFSWLFAKQNKGEFVLRVEDTDLERSDPRFEKDIIDGLRWLGIDWDNKTLYRQSERLELYEKFLKKLLEEKKAFYCSHSEEELAREREEQMKRKDAPRHICEWREGGANTGIIRLKNNFDGDIKFNDMIRGEISFKASLLGDFSLAKHLQAPLYNFAVVIDDYEMQISHVIRGEDHIPNTPKQVLIQQALNIPAPRYAHLPLILGKDRSKMSKRDGATSINEYKKDGYVADALINFIALLGWHGREDREIFSREELVAEFSFERIQKGGAVFDIDKLNWMNKEYIKSMDARDVAKIAADFLPTEWREIIKNNEKLWTRIIDLVRDRIVKFSDVPEFVDYFFQNPFYPKEMLRWKGKQNASDIVRHLNKINDLADSVLDSNFTKENLEKEIMPYAEKEGRGDVLWPFRVSLCGKQHSPGPFEMAAVLGRSEVLTRVKSAVALFG
ncbi:MAG: glutamate--tRNA ligase [Candidatus Niyogibacteria bacterium]|nr:glutamate--tRNA ligase [Candidatus Niyogibacteria bacterium]